MEIFKSLHVPSFAVAKNFHRSSDAEKESKLAEHESK